ncbi:MAG: diversity-generating retroelement protein Avd [Calditrichaceae bacterium]|nr:diversity-generating retroelement protein Avd [Calditrichaceae bacterium]
MNEDYPVFKKWYEITDWILSRCEQYPKTARFTISSRIANLTLDVVEKIIQAIYSKERLYILKEINIYLEKLRVFLRLSFERRYISGKQYEYIAGEIQEFGKMIGGWIRTCAG